MEKLFKSVLALSLILVMMFSLGACGGTKSGTGSQGGQTKAQEEQVTLTFWHSLAGSASGPVIDEFVKQYEKDHPNIKINQDTTQPEDYKTRKLKVAITNNSEGDVFLSYGSGYSQPFIDAGAVLQLDSYFEADKTFDRLQDGVLEYMTYGGKIYGVPITKWVGVLYCNTDYFERYGIEYPQTWDQFMTAIRTFREKGITPLTVGGKDGWHVAMYQNALAVRTAGAEYLNEALAGKKTLNTTEVARSAQLLLDLVNAGAFDPGVLGLSSDEANMEFDLGKIPMYYSGSWTASEVEDPKNSVKGKIKVMPLPTVDGGKGDATQFSGGATACYMVNSKTKHPNEAVAFAIALAEHQANEAYMLGDDITCWKGNIDEVKINPVLLEINKLTEGATGYVLAWDTFLVGAAIDEHYTLLQSLIGGRITAEEFAQKMEDAKVKALASEK